MKIRINHKCLPNTEKASEDIKPEKKDGKTFLTRSLRSGEVVKIGDEIALLLKRIKENRAEISIMAPREMKIIYEGKG